MNRFKLTFCWLFILLVSVMNSSVFAQATPDQIFEDLQASVFQIRMIEKKSGSRAALGTGFLIDENRIATNYHVVSMDVLEPDRYRIEIQLDDQSYALSVLTVDVVNDLAILSANDLPYQGEPFSLADRLPKQGTVLFSLGNPHNLGLTIVQGNYNGLVEHKFLDRIHYSGAINSGMSGGPAVDDRYRVVGINVASAGNQVGFLVPVMALRQLKARSEALSPGYDILHDIAQQIGETTDAMLDEVLAAEWPEETMGSAQILGKTVDWFECWGDSHEDKEEGRLEISRGCNNADNIYLSHRFTTGFFEYEYYYFEAPDWPVTAFYRSLRHATSGAIPGNKASKEDVENYRCENSHVLTGKGGERLRRRVSYCARPYKKLPGLYDVFFIGVSEDRENQAVMDHFTLSGVRPEASKKFLERFIKVLSWE